MSEDFNISGLVIPGTYIRVRSDGLIGVGGISTGNIAIVGTSELGHNETHTLSSLREAEEIFGRYDAWSSKTLNLMRALEQLYASGAQTVYARGIAAGNTTFKAEFELLLADRKDANILVCPEMDTATAATDLPALVDAHETAGYDLIAVVGCDKTKANDVTGQVKVNDRLIMCAPGIKTKEHVLVDGKMKSLPVTLPGTYTAACVAGLLSGITPQTSPTNKVISAIPALETNYSYGDLKSLISGGVMVLEDRGGVRVVRGISTDMKDNGAFQQVTTRRIVDFTKAGVRKVGDPFIGKLNNNRVRSALKGALQGFLDTLVSDEALTGYELEVNATRDDEINGRAIVNLFIQPTFSIDFIATTIVLG